MTKWTKEYDNDTGPCDDYFEEWWNVTDGNHIYRCKNSDDADFLIAALAQPEQKPVAWITKTGNVWKTKADETDTPLYTTPPQRTWVELTDGEIEDALPGYRLVDAIDIARSIEAKLREKN